MQTFLPYQSFKKSAECLDYKRLGKQRVECMQILTALRNPWAMEVRQRQGKPLPKNGWTNHPATVMWRDHQEALKMYMASIIKEWVRRGYKNTMEIPTIDFTEMRFPWWIGNKDFHQSHQSNLIRKDEDYYRQHFGEVPNDLPYLWPCPVKETFNVGKV